ncbi:MAG: hypothetical protein E6K18_03175 [Methanobacteriota archaeon]|nr:MAG: hypothetical protein E6K18_03175 [Euryarchaeota archaeon]
MTAPPPLDGFTAKERAVIARLRTPYLVQRWLKRLPYNWERKGETLRSFRRVVLLNTAHCLEAALSAATILEQHGYPPLLMDLESIDDLDHVFFLYRQDGRWGCVAASRDPGLFGRKPVFRTVRDLAVDFFEGYVDLTGRINGFGVLDLRTLKAVDWRLSERNVWAVQDALIAMPHRRLHMADAEYVYWHERYERYKRRFPDRKPAYYPRKRRWL